MPLSANMDQKGLYGKEACMSEENKTLLRRYVDEVWHKRNLGHSRS